MASTINGTSTGSGGLISTGDDSGILNIQTNETTAITVDASQRVAFVAGTAALPAITTAGDTNTGIYFPAADTIAFSEGGTESMRIDSSANVGIGTSSPSTRLSLQLSSATTYTTSTRTNQGLTIYNSSATTNGFTGIEFVGEPTSGNGGIAGIGSVITGSGSANLVFGTRDSATYAERMRIDSSGNVLVGTTDSTKGALIVGKAAPSAAYGQICAFSPTASDSNTSGMSVVKYATDQTTAQVFIRFLTNQGANGSGQINANGANAAAFGSYSDSRLKENIVDLPSQLASIMALRPVEFDYVESMGGGHQIGFIAQDVQSIYPDLVGESADGMLTLTDMNKNDARLIKAIQELKALTDTQAETINALTARIVALEQA